MPRFLQRLLPVAGGLILLALLLRQINPRDVIDLLIDLRFTSMTSALLWYLAVNVLRAFRFSLLLADTIAPWRLLPATLAMNFLNNVLPSRTGELSFPYLLRRHHDVALGESSTVLVLARIFDYLAVAVLFVLFALGQLQWLEAGAARIMAAVIALLLLTISILLLGARSAAVTFRILRRLTTMCKRQNIHFQRLLTQAEREIVATLQRVRNLRTYGLALIWSLGIWLAMFACFYTLLQALRLPQPYPRVVVGATFATLAKALPLVTIGGFGAHEAGWTLGFSLVGMGRAEAIISGFAVNILMLLLSAVSGGSALCYLMLRSRGRKRSFQGSP